MNKSILYLTVIVLMTITACSNKHNQLSPVEQGEGWELLFDGQSLDNWKVYNAEGTGSWLVEDGLLAASGTGSDSDGYIITKKQYNNFDLKFEWKIAEGGNSGVLYHVIESERYPLLISQALNTSL